MFTHRSVVQQLGQMLHIGQHPFTVGAGQQPRGHPVGRHEGLPHGHKTPSLPGFMMGLETLQLLLQGQLIPIQFQDAGQGAIQQSGGQGALQPVEPGRHQHRPQDALQILSLGGGINTFLSATRKVHPARAQGVCHRLTLGMGAHQHRHIPPAQGALPQAGLAASGGRQQAGNFRCRPFSRGLARLALVQKRIRGPRQQGKLQGRRRARRG